MRFSKRRAISQIIGALMMVAIVASVGSVLMFQGINAVQEFTASVGALVGFHTSSAAEDIIIEHVRMDPDTQNVDVYLTNIGTIDVIIRNIKILKIDTQHLVLDVDMSERILIHDRNKIIMTADLLPLLVLPLPPADLPRWGDPAYSANKEYLISVSTTLGTTFQKGISPYNT